MRLLTESVTPRPDALAAEGEASWFALSSSVERWLRADVMARGVEGKSASSRPLRSAGEGRASSWKVKRLAVSGSSQLCWRDGGVASTTKRKDGWMRSTCQPVSPLSPRDASSLYPKA